ncbi:MAG: GIY-YIG nuclease family protein [Thermoguttaceae bacterium]
MNKADIIELIRQTAKENGGQPLGQQRFESETGVRLSDWRGKHWARWGDALREAGFTPNRMATACPDEDLLERYAQLARELNRLPTGFDLRLKASNCPGFPAHNTFARPGSKSTFVERLLDFCRERQGYEDIVQLCETHAPNSKPPSQESEAQDVEIGFVYLLKSGRFCKIGMTNSSGRRQYELAIQLPEKVKRIHVIRTDDPGGIEAYWHKRFAEKRRNGEWFELSAADVAPFKRRKFM